MEAHQGETGAVHIEALRDWILAILALGLAGTVIELVLLGHYEQPLQFVPVVLILASAAALAWHVMRRDSASLHAVMIIMALFVLAGFVGFLAHFYGSAEFQLDLDRSMSTWDLLLKVLRAKAPPLLAPGMMMQLGLLGLAYVFSDARYRPRATRVLRFLRLKETR
jgi:hypothetical protein